MLNDKPVISNQHGALVMAFVPFCYALFRAPIVSSQLLFALSWLFLYLSSYPFFALFSKKPTARNQKWALIYVSLSLIFALPVLIERPALLQFLPFCLPLVGVQIYYAKQRDERNLFNDIAGILLFGIIGVANGYLSQAHYDWAVLIHPTLFFIATTFYIKSIARERKNPRYLALSLYSHLLLGILYCAGGFYFIAFAYFIALLRAKIVPNKKLNIKQVGMLEFPVVLIFFISLILQI